MSPAIPALDPISMAVPQARPAAADAEMERRIAALERAGAVSFAAKDDFVALKQNITGLYADYYRRYTCSAGINIFQTTNIYPWVPSMVLAVVHNNDSNNDTRINRAEPYSPNGHMLHVYSGIVQGMYISSLAIKL